MNQRRFHPLLTVLLISCLMILTTGCLEKQRAQWNINSTEKILFKAKDMQADKYASQQYTLAKSELDRAKKNLSSGDAKGAFEASKSAKVAAQQAFETARAAKAEADFKTAEQKFTVATENEGKRTNPALYQQIQDNLEQARKYYSRARKNYDKIIQYSNSVIDDVQKLLKEVIDLANKNVGEAQNTLEEARRNEAETRVYDAWVKAKALVDEAVKLKADEKYFKAIEKAKEAQTQADDANQLAMESKARDEIQTVEKYITALKDVDAQKYTRSDYLTLEDNYNRAKLAFNEKDYRIAIDQSKVIEARAPEVIEKAGRLKLEDQLKVAQQDIDLLKLNDAEKYAPTFLSEAEALLEEANKAFKNQEFEQAKSIHKDIRDKIDLANARLRDRASQQITDADIAIKDAEDANASVLAPEILKTARELRDNAQNLMDNKRFRDSILMAQNTITKAQEAKTEAIRKKAEISLNESEKAISEAVGNGASLYASEDIQEARDLLKQGRDALQGGQYTKAQDLSLQVSNKVADSYTTMRKKAVAQIDEARKAIDYAGQDRIQVSHYPQPTQTLALAKQKMLDAENLLNDKKYSKAIETAVDSRATAVEAKNTAIRLQIADRTPTVQLQIEEAKLAGAYSYAIEEYDKAIDNLKMSHDNLAAGKYDLALDNIDAAEEHAGAALKGQINKARDMIESAKSIGAWQHDPADMQIAVVQFDSANENLKARRYPESLAAANASIVASSKARDITRDRIFMGEIGQINLLLANAKIASALIPEKVADIKKKTDDAQAVYENKKEGNAEDKFTKGMETLAKLKTEAANLDSEAKAKRDELSKLIESGINASKQADADKYAEKELNQAEESWREAEAAYKRQDYLAAKAAYDSALAALKQVETRRQEKEYKDALGVQLVHLNTAMADFAEVIELSPTYMKQIKDGKLLDTYKRVEHNFHNVVTLSPDFFISSKGDNKHDPYSGIQGKLTAGKFRQITTETFVRVKNLKVPPTMKDFHNSKVMPTFEEAKLAGEFFDKFGYHQEYTPETRDSFIDAAFLHIKNCWAMKHEVDTFLQGPQPEEHQSDNFWSWAFKKHKSTPESETFLEWMKGN